MQPFHQPSTPVQRTFIPLTVDSPEIQKESHMSTDVAARQAREAADNVVRDYESKRDK